MVHRHGKGLPATTTVEERMGDNGMTTSGCERWLGWDFLLALPRGRFQVGGVGVQGGWGSVRCGGKDARIEKGLESRLVRGAGSGYVRGRFMSSSRRARSKVWRRWLGNLLIVFLGLIALVLLVGLFLPRTYRVVRTVEVRAAPQVVYADLATLRQWPEWTVWNKEMDPTAEFEFSGPESGVGAAYRWKGAKLGQGELKLTEADPNRGVRYALSFEGGAMQSVGGIEWVATGTNGLKVTWSDEGDLGRSLVNRYLGLMLDSMIGTQFEQGLARLKARAESGGGER